jgi:acyl-CoA synthetase (AMP-forming)/AMP-acid ligase II
VTTTQQTLQGRIYERLERAPHQRALAFQDDPHKVTWLSIEQFVTASAGYAAALSEMGLRQGDVCLLVLPSEPLLAHLLMASLLTGSLPLLIAPPSLQRNQALSSLEQVLSGIMRRTRPGVVVLPENMAAQRDRLAAAYRGARLVFGAEELSAVPDSSYEFVRPSSSDVAAMQLTSGTTGFPRVCVWRQANVTAALDGMWGAMRLTSDDICLNWTPLYHDMGLVNNFFLCITGGVPLVMQSPTDFVREPVRWLRSLHVSGATTTWSPNFGFALAAQRIGDDEMKDVRLDGVRAFWNAAERIHLETLLAFQRRFTPYGLAADALKTNFGCAENVGGATFSSPDGRYIVEHVDRRALYEKGIAQPHTSDDAPHSVPIVSAGRPYVGMRIEIHSPRGTALPDGHVGEIALDTPSRMVGYLKNERATRRALDRGLLRTGDLGYMRDGELFWVGRVRERINIRGKKLDPSEFERVLLQIPDLRAGCFAAFGVDDPQQGTQQIVVVSEVRQESTAQPGQIAGEIRNQVFLSMGLNVGDVVLVRPGVLAKTSSGKRRHRYFQRLYLEGRLMELAWSPNGEGEASRVEMTSG